MKEEETEGTIGEAEMKEVETEGIEMVEEEEVIGEEIEETEAEEIEIAEVTLETAHISKGEANILSQNCEWREKCELYFTIFGKWHKCIYYMLLLYTNNYMRLAIIQ